MAVPVLPLNEMSIDEKLQAMEALWENLSTDPSGMARSGIAGPRGKNCVWHSHIYRLGKS